MSAINRRVENRVSPTIITSPLSCLMNSNGIEISLKIINYHYRGACFQTDIGNYQVLEKNAFFQFSIGTKALPEKIQYRVVWESISENGLFGVEFSTASSYVLARAERFETHSINPPVVTCKDPTDPNRIIYFKAANISKTGILLETSLSNKHLFPGMELRNAQLNIPSMGEISIDLFIENSRSPNDGKNVLYGTSLKSQSKEYLSLITNYLSNLGSYKEPNERIEKLSEQNLIQKNLRKHLTIREVSSESEYADVLKLRFKGYKRAGKLRDDKTVSDMGPGLDSEGVVLGAYLGGQLVASCEYRPQSVMKLKISDKINVEAFPKIRKKELAEINNLVVHPSAQNTDIVLGIFQKIHALAMLNGRPDGLIFADDKLVALYERLGFIHVGYKTPHPIKEGVNLNLMTIYSEAYASSEGMNPYAWSVAFEESHKFFSSVGIQSQKKLSFSQIFVKFSTKLVVGLSQKKKKSEEKSSVKHTERTTRDSRDIADPRWTLQHLNATIILPYILESFELIGREKTVEILLDFGFDVSYFRRSSNWVSIEFFNEFTNKFSKYGDPFLLNKKAGYRSTSKEILGANYFIIKHFFSPNIAFKSFEKFLPKFNKTRIYKVLESGRNFCRIRITNPDKSLVPTHQSTRENWIALIDAYVLVLTGRSADIQLVSSTFDGDEYCEYLVKWKSSLFTKKNAIFLAALLGTAYYLGEKIFGKFTVKEIAVVSFLTTFLAGFLILVLKWRSTQKKYVEMIESLATFEKHAEEKYRELQTSKSILEKSYQEGKLLESIHKEIQTSDDLKHILEVALESSCTKLNFKRAFIMIIDDENKFLRTSAVFGNNKGLVDIWNFKVDVSVKRENPLVLSSVFHTGQSILLNDLEEHKFHLNDASKALIEKLGTKGFTIVPVPSETKNWGVLVADKGTDGDLITRRDLVALQRVSQSIGLALDKKAKIDSEKRIRKIFQKYVPLNVLETTLGVSEPKLGGETKEVICLFMDIRNFTLLSNQIPPQILVDILNDIYTKLHEIVFKNGGVIDKFLGDGALVTWGAIPGSSLDPKCAVESAKEFNSALENLNKKLSGINIPAIEVGFGIHRGPVIAGNIGSNERMEYTVIGSTVNIASRLEQLTKVFKANIVISETVIPFSELTGEWKVQEGVQVRGVDSHMRVACFGENSQSTRKVS